MVLVAEGTVDSNKLQYDIWTMYATFPSSLGFAILRTVTFQLSGFGCNQVYPISAYLDWTMGPSVEGGS